MRQLLLDLAIPRAPTLTGFIPGRNAELLALLNEMAAGARHEPCLYIWGEPGVGKSHLLQAAASGGGCYIAATAASRFDSALAGLPLVAVDNVDRLDDTGAVDLFNVYNAIQEAGGTLLASGSCPPQQLRLRADLATRLGWGLVFQVHPLSDVEKIAALQTHASARGFNLADELGHYLLSHWQRDMSALFAALDALDRYSLETKRPVTLPLLREAIAAISPSPQIADQV